MTSSIFKIIYILTVIVLALIGYILDPDKSKFFKIQRDGAEDDEEDKKMDVRKVFSDVICVIVFIGLVGLVFVLSDTGDDIVDGVSQVASLTMP